MTGRTYSDERIMEFLVESHENLEQVDLGLVSLEKDPAADEVLAEIFRVVHTIKGTCGFFGFSRLEALTHAGEDLLSLLRDGRILVTKQIIEALLGMVDSVRRILSSIEKTREEGDHDASQVKEKLIQLRNNAGPARSSQAPPAAETAVPPPAPGPPEAPRFAAEASQTPAVAPVTASGVWETNVRVDISVLDKLMDLVGELVLTRNQLLQLSSMQKERAFVSASQRLNLITTELQQEIMRTRLQRLRNIWRRFPRLVRDIASQCGKRVRLEMEGDDTELDKSLLEAVKDPLTHLLRNAVDHGIEDPAVRIKSGKDVEGCVRLRASHENGQVLIEVQDDGDGIDPERVRRRAVERELITPEHAALLSQKDALSLIFMPGFSIAEKVTSVSGRGVGLDVVRTNVEKIGGTVDLETKPGHGTTFKIKIPLTLSIIPALIVSTGGDRYAIPQANLLELVRVQGNQGRGGIEMINSAPVYRLRGKLLPLVDLGRALGLTPIAAVNPGESESAAAAINIVVLHAENRQFGLIVEGISDTEEIVVKPLGKCLKGLSIYSGGTIMGDGKVALILDVLSMAERARLVAEVRLPSLAEKAAPSSTGRRDEDVLLLGKGAGSALR
ncbi:MAG TPA: chemotaxis protein CheA, partial [Planctomycetota bacterium]|nr:chemotaxis protein CheA [Planctomycetota bacterium]